MATMNDVIEYFNSETGLEWYPNPGHTTKVLLLAQLVDKIEEIIAAQARATGQQHVAAQEDRGAELQGEAVKAFDEVRQWVVELSEDQRAELRKFNHAVV